MTRDEALTRNVQFLQTPTFRDAWIGFEDASTEGGKKNFIYWRGGPDSIVDLEAMCEELWNKRHIEAKIGPAVDVAESKNSGVVITGTHNDTGAEVLGLYIEEKHRFMFTFTLSLG